MECSLGEATEGLHGAADGAPVGRLAVVTLLQEVLAPTVVGVLVEDPEALHDLAGVDLTQVELLGHGGAVVVGIVGLACKLGLVVELHLILGSAGLQVQRTMERAREGERGGKGWNGGSKRIVKMA